MSHLVPNTQEWIRAWGILASHPLNIELPDPPFASNNGEVWQYMGTSDKYHTFRHRCHPVTTKREYCHIPVQ
jgi:hypothetical protein